MTPSQPPIDLLITDLSSFDDHTIHAQSERGRNYLARLLEFHDFPCLGPGNNAVRVHRRDLDDWIFSDIQAKELGLFTYAEHPQTGALELACVVGQHHS